MIFAGFDHEIGDVGARDIETEGWEMSDCCPVLAGGRFVGQLRWAYQGPIEPALSDDAFHSAGVGGTEEWLRCGAGGGGTVSVT